MTGIFAKLTSLLGLSPCIGQPPWSTGAKPCGSAGSVFKLAISPGELLKPGATGLAPAASNATMPTTFLAFKSGTRNVLPPPAECASSTAGPISSSSAEMVLAATASPQYGAVVELAVQPITALLVGVGSPPAQTVGSDVESREMIVLLAVPTLPVPQAGLLCERPCPGRSTTYTSQPSATK